MRIPRRGGSERLRSRARPRRGRGVPRPPSRRDGRPALPGRRRPQEGPGDGDVHGTDRQPAADILDLDDAWDDAEQRQGPQTTPAPTSVSPVIIPDDGLATWSAAQAAVGTASAPRTPREERSYTITAEGDRFSHANAGEGQHWRNGDFGGRYGDELRLMVRRRPPVSHPIQQLSQLRPSAPGGGLGAARPR